MKQSLRLCRALKAFFWPLEAHEIPKVLSMFFLLFFIIFNYVILRVCKDTLILSASDSGAAAIPFIKIWVVPPVAFILMAIQIKLFSLFDRIKVFTINVIAFLAFYFFFIFIMYPHLEWFAPVNLVAWMNAHFSQNFAPFVTMIQYWPISLFYVLAEMWASVVMGLLFWGLANDITRMEDAKRFYGFLGVGGNLAYFAAGMSLDYLISRYSDLKSMANVMDLLHYVAAGLLICGLIAIVLYRATLYFLRKEEQELAPELLKVTEDRLRPAAPMGVMESLSFVLKNSYLRNLALMVIGYGITINLVEVLWKSQVKEYFPSALETLNFMARVQIHMSYLAIFFLFISGPLIKKFGWRFAALVCPVIILGTGVLFFGLVLFKDVPFSLFLAAGLTPLALSVWVGFWQNVLSKASKNSIFNVAKELAFIPLDNETRIKGKAAIDVLGERFGKFGGSFVCMALLIVLGDVGSTIVPTATVLFIMTLIWIYSTTVVGKKLSLIEKENTF